MKRYLVCYQVPAGPGVGPAMAEFEADHYSVSAAGLAHFYRTPPRTGPRDVAPKDELVGSVATPLTIILDEKSGSAELRGSEMEEELLDLVGEVLGLKSVDKDEVFRITVTRVE